VISLFLVIRSVRLKANGTTERDVLPDISSFDLNQAAAQYEKYMEEHPEAAMPPPSTGNAKKTTPSPAAQPAPATQQQQAPAQPAQVQQPATVQQPAAQPQAQVPRTRTWLESY
jgi:hypothetical protein